MSKKWASRISIVSAIIVAIVTLVVLSKVTSSPKLGVAILLAFGVWGITRGVLYTATGTHIVVGWWRRLLWHLVPLAVAASVLVFVGGVKLAGKGGWELVAKVMGSEKTTQAQVWVEAKSVPLADLPSKANTRLAKAARDVRSFLVEAKATPGPEAIEKPKEGVIVTFGLGWINDSGKLEVSPLDRFKLALRDKSGAKVIADPLPNAKGQYYVSADKLVVNGTYELLVVDKPSGVSEVKVVKLLRDSKSVNPSVEYVGGLMELTFYYQD